MTIRNLEVHLRTPHPKQNEFIVSDAKRKVVRAGRRGGKTVGVSVLAVLGLLAGKRVLYAVPTTDQLTRFWYEVKRALSEPLEHGVFYKNETEHVIELPGTEQRIRGKTAWNADTLRGDFADLLILDEWQLMNEDAWGLVGAPMLLDNNGDAVFVYTPPSIRSRSASKATDKMHAAKLFKRAQADATGRWATFHFTSHDNPHISTEALEDITQDMTALAHRQEILAEDIDSMPGALWNMEMLDRNRVVSCPPLVRVVVAIDPAVTAVSDSSETGVAVAGIGENGHGYVVADYSQKASPLTWARSAIDAYNRHEADRVIGEVNNGGDLVETTLRMVDASLPFTAVHASRGKYTRAEPVAALYEQGMVHHVGTMPSLESQMVTWVPGDASPDRMDALVWAITELMIENNGTAQVETVPNREYSISAW